MPHFFVTTKNIKDDKIIVTEKETFHHLSRVLRIKKGEELLLTDENQTTYQTVVEEIQKDKIIAQIRETQKTNHFLKTQIYLVQAVLKNDAQNLVIQKAVELGVKGIIPFVSDNTVVKMSVVDSKIDKWRKIALEAVKQCERTDIPEIFERASLKEIIENPEYNVKIACVEREQKLSLKNFLNQYDFKKEDKILVIIGPEGGFSSREIELLKSHAQCVSLGKLILRAETAVITALSNIIYELE